MPVTGAFMTPHPPLIIPEVGKGQERAVEETARSCRIVAERIASLKPETIVVTTPHSVMYADYFHISPGSGARGDFGGFRVPEVSVEAQYDEEFVGELCRLAGEAGLRAGTLGEKDPRLDHGTMVPLYFVNQRWQKYRLVRIGLSGLSLTDHYVLGQIISRTSETLGRRTVVIASGDLSHHLSEEGPYGYSEEGPAYDKRIMEVMGNGCFGELFTFGEDFCEKAGECGHRSFTILAGVLDRREVRAESLSYQGPFGVGYGVCAFEPLGEAPDRNFKDQYQECRRRELEEKRRQEDGFVRLARESLEYYVRNGEVMRLPADLPAELRESRAGSFVSLKKEGCLRGCIGTTSPARASLAEEIVHNAVSAGAYDPRFPPVEERELELLDYSVDVLGEPEPVSDGEAELDPKRYGVIVTGKGNKRGLLLPDLEGVDTVEQQLRIARRKAGIDPEAPVKLERFEVVRHR